MTNTILIHADIEEGWGPILLPVIQKMTQLPSHRMTSDLGDNLRKYTNDRQCWKPAVTKSTRCCHLVNDWWQQWHKYIWGTRPELISFNSINHFIRCSPMVSLCTQIRLDTIDGTLGFMDKKTQICRKIRKVNLI